MLAALSTRSRSYPALPESVPDARTWAARAAARAGAARDVVESVRLAVSEAATNVVLHAYPETPGEIQMTPDTPGEIQMTVAVAEEEFWVLVADEGQGHQRAPETPGLGWGLALIANACQDFLITERSGVGTEVRMGFDLSGADRFRGAAGLRLAA